MSKGRVYIGSDHGGFELKKALTGYLEGLGYEVVDIGAKSYDPADDYPDYAKKLCAVVVKEKALGILACKSGQGMNIAANKANGIRAVIATDVYSAMKSREHLDANVLCIGSEITSEEDAKKITSAWIETSFSNEARHVRRLGKIDEIDGKVKEIS